MDTLAQQFVGHKRIALAGASRNGKTKFGNAAAKELADRGYEVFLVHPEAKEIDGQPCYPSLAAVKDKVDGVLVCVPPRQAENVLREAAAVGLRDVWLQQGAETDRLLALGKELGLNVVSRRCILMYAQPVRSFHKWHRMFNQVTGQL